MGRRAPPSTHKAQKAKAPLWGASRSCRERRTGRVRPCGAARPAPDSPQNPDSPVGFLDSCRGHGGNESRRLTSAGFFSLLLRGRSGDGVSAGIALVAFFPFLALRARRPRVTLRTFEATCESERCDERRYQG